MRGWQWHRVRKSRMYNSAREATLALVERIAENNRYARTYETNAVARGTRQSTP
jgi:hypothetical protein